MLDTIPEVDRTCEGEREPAAGSGPALAPFIDGGAWGGSGPTAALLEPATGEEFARVAYAGPDDVDAAVESSARAFSLWRGTPFKERRKRLQALARGIHARSDEIARLIAREQGKPCTEALNLEVLPALDHLQFILQHGEQYHSGSALYPRHPFYAHKRAHYLHDPLGVVALVTPSPLPFAAPLIQLAAAIAMGNAVVLKPSERTPLSALWIGDMCIDAGFPSGLVNVIPAQPEDTIRLVAHPRVEKVFFTGGIDAGRHVMATAGCTPRPVILSLGGNHPSVVAADADVKRAARGVVWGAVANCGQNCGAVQRVYVEEKVAAAFLDCVHVEVDRLRQGNPLQAGVDIGPLQNERLRQDVHARVIEAVEGGGRLTRGGVLPSGPGFFYPPTVLLDPPVDSRLMREETLGPVIPIVVVENLERAILQANDSDHALTASGWTRSSDTAERLMVGLEAGVVTVNDVLYSYGEPAAAWSGYRKSGIGCIHGTQGLREMSRQRFVSFDSLSADAPLSAFPYDDAAAELVQTALDYRHSGGRLKRWRAMLRLLGQKRFRSRVPLRSLLFPSR